MASLEMNKVAGAILTAGVIAMTSGFIAHLLVNPHKLEQNVYTVAGAEAPATDAEEAGPSLEPVSPLLATADIEAGKKVARKCTACHSFDEGGADKIGPALWGIVDRQHAASEGYSYSSALADMASVAWGYEELNAFLAKPKEYAPGTKMSFAGLKKAKDRANLILYLRSLSGSPAALPE